MSLESKVMKFSKKYILAVVPVIALLVWLVLTSAALKKPQSSLSTGPKQLQSSFPESRQDATGKDRKETFFSYLLPLIKTRNSEIANVREQLQLWHKERDDLSSQATRKVQQLAKEYRLNDFSTSNELHWKTLLRRIDVVSPSLALAQAANESAWGTSRFAREARNYYGQWCFSKGCGLVPKLRGNGQIHEVAKFSSAAESVNSYIKNLNSHPAYAELRKIRAHMRAAKKPLQGTELAKGLGSYSERGDAYIKELQAMIRHNKLQQYDQI